MVTSGSAIHKLSLCTRFIDVIGKLLLIPVAVIKNDMALLTDPRLQIGTGSDHPTQTQTPAAEKVMALQITK